MLIRTWSVTLLICALWGYLHNFRYQVLGLFWLAVPLGVLGGLALRSHRPDEADGDILSKSASHWKILDSWGRAWSFILLGFWIVTLGPQLLSELEPLTGSLWIRCARGVDIALPYVLPTSVLIGYLARLERARGGFEPTLAIPLQLGLYFFLVVLLAFTPQVTALWSLPVLALLGLTPWSSSQVEAFWTEKIERADPPYQTSLAAVIEMLSLQLVGWGAVLAFLRLFQLFVEGKYLEGVAVAIATGLGCWLGSGLIWGLSDHLQRGLGESAVRALALILFGARPSKPGELGADPVDPECARIAPEGSEPGEEAGAPPASKGDGCGGTLGS